MKTIKIGAKPTKPEVKSVEAWVDGDQTSSIPAEPLKRLTIEISKSLHHQVKIKCLTDGRSMADVVRGLLNSYCSNP
jgi:hypothetical protein